MRKKKGQVTIFIIVLLFIIGIIIISFLFRDNLGLGNKNKVDNEVSMIDSAIENCVEQRTIDAVRMIGLQGGYIIPPENYLETDLSNIAYGLYNGKKILISEKEIEKEISNYLKLTLPFCIDENEFSEFNLSFSEPSASSKIKQESVVVKARLPISASRDLESFTINREYETEVSIRLGEIYNIADEIVEKSIKEPEFIDIDYLVLLDYDVNFVSVDDNTLIYSITDLEYNIEGIPYSFVFGVDLG